MAESGRRSTRARRAPKTRNQQETVRKTAGRKSKKAALTEPKEGEHSLKHILAGQDLVVSCETSSSLLIFSFLARGLTILAHSSLHHGPNTVLNPPAD